MLQLAAVQRLQLVEVHTLRQHGWAAAPHCRQFGWKQKSFMWARTICCTCNSCTKQLLISFLPYIPFCTTGHFNYLQREKGELKPWARLTGEIWFCKVYKVLSFSVLTWSCLSPWQKFKEPVFLFAASTLSLWQPNAFDTWVIDGEREADRSRCLREVMGVWRIKFKESSTFC